MACQRFGVSTKIQNKIDHTTQASSKRILMMNYFHKILKVFILLYTFTFQPYVKKTMAPFYGWGLAASMLEPLQGGSLLFTTEPPEIPGNS